MKTICLLISSDNILADKIISQETDFDIILRKSVLTAINYTHNTKNKLVVLYDANSETKSALKYIKFLKENLRKDILFYVIAKKKDQIEALFVKGVNDVFTADIEIQNIYLRSKLLDSRLNENNMARLEIDPGNIPLWKRAFDILFSLTAIIVLMPVFILIVSAIRMESKGKVFYASKRVGTGFRIFDFYKFRSMYTDADTRVDSLLGLNQYGLVEKKSNDEFKKLSAENQSSQLIGDDEVILETDYLTNKTSKQGNTFFKMANDPRITKVGRVLRNTSLDELPQLFNILKGQMSVVGNRPLPLYEAEMLTSDKWAKRFLAPAGLTGLWQVTKRGNANSLSPDERKQLDIDYIESFSFKNDLSIIMRTVPALIQHENV
ncbi:MAG: sugar transferase [Bacteroidales bacterium]|nr:sugar transferase [Bacteroidales bacterium]MCF8391511.1 sugar transferase [Bacteroidales bacterium]